jgi:uncharacterized membrane protein
MRKILIAIAAAAAAVAHSPANAQIGVGIDPSEGGAVRIPSFRDSDVHRHYWIPDGALGPAAKKCRFVIVRKKLPKGAMKVSRRHRCG